MSGIRKMFYKVFGIAPLKTLIFNLRYFGFKGVKFPVLVYRNIRLQRLGGKVVLNNPRFCGVKLGAPWAGLYAQSTRGGWNVEGTVCFEGECKLATANIVSCSEGAVINFGANFQANDGCRFISVNEISFGSNCLLSWDCTFIDSDFHSLRRCDGLISNVPRSITVGEHCWIGFGSRITKGASLPEGCVIASGSLVTKAFDEGGLLIGGTNKILDHDIVWEM